MSIIVDKELMESIQYGDDDWDVVEEGDWSQDYKYQHQTNVVLHKPTGKYYQYEISRSGSPFTDWEYSHSYGDYPDLVEVVQKERTVTQKYWSVV